MARGNDRFFAISHQPDIAVDAQSTFRVASISKVIVGRAIAGLVAERAVTWGTDVSDVLGWRLRHPAHPETPVTLAMVAAHHAGFDDAAGYALPPEIDLKTWFGQGDMFSHPPGSYFSYSNLGYIVLAEVIECLSGQPFAQAVAKYLPADAGFNWINVPAAARKRALPTYRFDGARYLPQIDSPATTAPPAQNAGRYSPQGGLRTSMDGMLTIAQGLATSDATPLWSPASGEGGYFDGVFESYGAGLQIYQTPVFYPRPLIGHFGNAYGFNGGVWYDRAHDLAFAYALNGLPMNDETDAFSTAELRVFDAISQIEE